MPKATKLHVKGKSNSIQKPCKVDRDKTEAADTDESMRQFQLELCWCIQQLERSLADKKGNDKQMQEAWKVLTVLKNNNQPIIRKRQLMRTHFGDYRAKMAAEEKKLAKMASKIKISEAPDKPKATFLRKSAFLTTGNSSFRFNFNLASEQIDNADSTVDLNNSNTVVKDNNTEDTSSVAITENIDDDKDDNSIKIKEDKSNNFKFSFSDSEFKFNFNINDS
ncbi:UPF0488 protein CG14286 [Galleria mellonella]|uniref:UPF0488 protein CG14286 n=1 Tax=Galleria mellonella TaxID=7137 RepID=A0A6J1X4Z3_GALME|nr:UPF0488 protein CG14286 [Galleria mellonella]